MNRPSNAREALIAEALGEIASLLDRVEAVVPLLDAASKQLGNAGLQLARQSEAMESRLASIAETATVQAVKHIARRTQELARNAADTETEALQAAGRTLFRAELGPMLQRLSHSLEAHQKRAERWQVRWSSNVITAVASSALTWMLADYVLAH